MTLRGRGRVALPLALALGAACFEPAPPTWKIEDPRLLLIEMEVVEAGPDSTPLTLDPPGLTRREGLPGDRLALRPIVVGPDGPVEPNGAPIWLRSRGLASGYFEAPIQSCAEDPAEILQVCRLDGPEVVMPQVAFKTNGVVSWFVVVVFGTPGGPTSEACLERLSGDGSESLHGCLVGEASLTYGPPHGLVPYGLADPATPVTDPNYNLVDLALSLEIRGASGVRTHVAAHGEIVEVDPDDAIAAKPIVDDAQRQEYVEEGGELATEGLYRIWWSDAEIFDHDWNAGIEVPESRFTIPPNVARVDLYLQILDRPPYFGARGNWLWVRLQVRGRSGSGS
ncbi:MAG: hypothetical protein R3B09_19270 [Nannocystaceae bacterium]